MKHSDSNTGLQPRSYFSTVIMLFGINALPFALLSSLTMGNALSKTIPAGLFFGLFFGLIMAMFLKGDTIKIYIENKDEFISQINIAMSQIGFNPVIMSDDFLGYVRINGW